MLIGLTLSLIAWAPVETPAPARYEPRYVADVPNQPFDRFETTDRLGRTITFYVTESRGPTPRPLVVFVQGSGCQSSFVEVDGRIHPNGGHPVIPDVAGTRAQVLVVEKPGVEYLDAPADCREAALFNREHTLPRWAAAVEAAIRACHALPRVDAERTLVVGHSEGGLVACRVAREMPDEVTHVASLAGGGPSQLFDLLTLTRRGEFFAHVSDDPDERVAHVLECWHEIQVDPMSAERSFFGFAHRRWSTFLATSPMQELPHVEAAIYIAQGTEDRAVDPASADALYAQLVAGGVDVRYDRQVGADHSFRFAARPDVDGWAELFGRVIDWFLEP